MRRRRTAHRFGEKRRTTDVLIDEKVDFTGLMLSNDVLEGLKSSGFERPSPIQLKAIPLGRCGLDLIAQAKSGTGKTCVFSVIALENVNLAVNSVQVLVLAPTREIAVQIKDVMCSIGRHLQGLQTHVFIGGMSLEEDKSHLKQCHIAIGSPGRIKHLIESKLLQTSCIRLFILDEADKLLEESFESQTNWIFSTLPVSKQMLALSATYPDHLAEKLKNYMKDPAFVCLNVADPSLEGICHYRCVVPSHSLPHKVFHEKVQSLLQLFTKLSFHQCLIFSNYQVRARSLSETLSKNGWPSTYISGNQAQNERLSAMAKLKDFKCRILISTDLTSRGIDAERVNLVINMDLPHDSETYLHRVGRAGRFGSYGAAVNFVAEGKEVTSLDEIQTKCGVTITSLPDDVSKILSDEILDVKKTDCKNINKQEADSIQHTKKINSDLVEVDSQMVVKETMVDEIRYTKVDENKKVEIYHKETKNEINETQGEGNEQQAIIAVGSNVSAHLQNAKNKLNQRKQDASKEIDVEQEEEKVEIQSNEAMRNIEKEIVAKDETKFLNRLPNDKERTKKFEIEYQEKQNENTQGARNIEEARIEEKGADVMVESLENGSLMDIIQLEDKVQQKDVDSKETCVVETQETGNFEDKVTRPIEIFGFAGNKIVDKTDNVDDASKPDKAIDDEDNVKYKEADDKAVHTAEASNFPQSTMVYRKKVGVDQTMDNELNNTRDERVTSRQSIFSQENAETSFDMDDWASEEYFSDEDDVSDFDEYECSSSEETESSRDSHVPISCKDFDNDLEAYLKRAAYLSNEEVVVKSDTSSRSQLKDRLSRQADGAQPIYSVSVDAIYANDSLPSGTRSNARAQSPYRSGQSAMRKDENNSKPVEAEEGGVYANESLPSRANSSIPSFGKSSKYKIQEDVNYSKPDGAQGNGDYASKHRTDERSRGLSYTQNNNEQNSEKAMFYGATLDDVTAYMARLPAEWKRTWYRVYDKQTKFLWNYRKFCHDNF